MAIQFMSDLHLERAQYDFDISRAAPVLALAGDIGRFSDYDAYADFLSKQCQIFDHVLLVAGNNEYYGSSHDVGLQAAQKLVDEPSMCGKLIFLDRTRYDIPHSNLTVLGCTLHSYIGPDCTKLNKDFEKIHDWKIENHNEEHQLALNWLQQALAHVAQTEPEKQVVILTHHAPSFENTCHSSHENNDISPCFCSDTLRVFEHWHGRKQVSDWVYGHAHWNSSFVSGSTLVQSNCLMNSPRELNWWQRRLYYRPFNPRATIGERSRRPWWRIYQIVSKPA